MEGEGGVGNRQSQPASPSAPTPKCFTMISQHGQRPPRSLPEPSREGLLTRPGALPPTVDYSPPASHTTPPHPTNHHARGARSGSLGGGGSVAVAVAVLCHTKRLFLDTVAPQKGITGVRKGGGWQRGSEVPCRFRSGNFASLAEPTLSFPPSAIANA